MHAGSACTQRPVSSRHAFQKSAICFRRQQNLWSRHHAQSRKSRRIATAKAGMQPVVCVTSVTESNFEQEVIKQEKGKWVLVDFWATWCEICTKEASEERRARRLEATKTLTDLWIWGGSDVHHAAGPCKLMDPFLKQIEEEFSGSLKVVKIEADPNPNLVEKYKVYGLPTLILFKDGSMLKGSLKEGAITKPMLLKYLEQHGVSK